MSPDFIGTKEVAEKLQLSEQRVRTLLKQQKIVGQQLGKQWVISRKSFQDYVNDPKNHVNPLDKSRVGTRQSGPIALSFFSGAMGLDLGLERAGIDVLLACEFDKACRKTIVANRPDIALLGDVWDYSGKQIREAAGLAPQEKVDIVVGGPPCQAFSTAGTRRGFNDDRGNALIRYLELIDELQPDYAVIENVRGLLSAAIMHRPHAKRSKDAPLNPEEFPGGAMLLILERLREMGYGVSFNLYNSANFGSPQIRERVVMLCRKGGKELPYLPPTHSDDPRFGLPRWRTFREAVAGLEPDQHTHLNFPEKRLKYYRLLSAGQNWKHLPLELQKEAMGNSFYAGGGKTGFLRRLDWDKPSPTLVTHPAMPATDLAHPEENRPLSIEEYKRIQEFPDDWVLCGSLLDQYKQVGNAVPVSLGAAIGKLIIDDMRGIEIKPFPGFKYSRYIDTDSKSWEEKHRLIHAAGASKENLALFDVA